MSRQTQDSYGVFVHFGRWVMKWNALPIGLIGIIKSFAFQCLTLNIKQCTYIPISYWPFGRLGDCMTRLPVWPCFGGAPISQYIRGVIRFDQTYCPNGLKQRPKIVWPINVKNAMSLLVFFLICYDMASVMMSNSTVGKYRLSWSRGGRLTVLHKVCLGTIKSLLLRIRW